jgi:hypothetical protein
MLHDGQVTDYEARYSEYWIFVFLVFSALCRVADSARPRPATRAYARGTIPPTMLEGMSKAASVAAVGRARPVSAMHRPHPLHVPFGLKPTN